MNPPGIRILIATVSPYRGGAEEYLLTMARAAGAAGHEVIVALSPAETLNSLRADCTDAGARIEDFQVTDLDLAWRNKKSPRALWRFLRKSRDLLARCDPQVLLIVQPSLKCAFGLMAAAAWERRPTAVVFQLVSAVFPMGRMQRMAYSWIRHRGQAWVAVSGDNRDLAAISFGCSPDRLRVIYNGASLPEAPPESERAAIRATVRHELGLSEARTFCLVVARLYPQKGHIHLVEALPSVVATYPDAVFVLVGEGPDEASLRTRAEELGVADHLRFLGHRDDVPRLLHSADLFVLPTLFEGQPFALVEAMAAGLPIVTTDASGIPELITNDVHGLICPKGDADALANALRHALACPEKRLTWGRAARERAGDFTEDKMTAQTLALLASLARKTPAHG